MRWSHVKILGFPWMSQEMIMKAFLSTWRAWHHGRYIWHSSFVRFFLLFFLPYEWKLLLTTRLVVYDGTYSVPFSLFSRSKSMQSALFIHMLEVTFPLQIVPYTGSPSCCWKDEFMLGIKEDKGRHVWARWNWTARPRYAVLILLF